MLFPYSASICVPFPPSVPSKIYHFIWKMNVVNVDQLVIDYC